MERERAHGREVFVARQPILDPHDAVVAYELLFRASADAQSAGRIVNPKLTSFQTMVDAFMRIGAETLLGRSRGFVNVPPDLLLSELVEALPQERVVLEVLETTRPSTEVVGRCAELVARGYELALDDWVPGDPRAPLLPFARYVKVDVMATDAERLPQVARSLRDTAGVALLAEKVETREHVARCRQAGFELFQGYFFARPQTVSARTVDPRRAAVLAIFRDLSADADVDVLGEHFKRTAELGVGLLRLVNSVALARREQIATLEHALAMLGRQQLRRWLVLLLFAGAGEHGLASPLLQASAVRGRLMELLARGERPDRAARERGERAFLAGMVSLLDVALGLPHEQLVRELHLEPEVGAAILRGDGELGALLALASDVERGELPRAQSLVERIGLDPERLLRAEAEAWAWTDEVIAGAGSLGETAPAPASAVAAQE